jgi:hypothetical protein
VFPDAESVLRLVVTPFLRAFMPLNANIVNISKVSLEGSSLLRLILSTPFLRALKPNHANILNIGKVLVEVTSLLRLVPTPSLCATVSLLLIILSVNVDVMIVIVIIISGPCNHNLLLDLIAGWQNKQIVS